MQHNIRRNKKAFDYLNQQLKRLNWNIPIDIVFENYIFENLSVIDSKEVVNYTQRPINDDILNIEAVYNETIKFIGLVEVATNSDELKALVARKKEIKYGKELTDFDKVLKAILTVPNKKDNG
eukprot:TRINITY_DN85657_c0_g1_i1.p2 TRINITY_DN85657_c0_g1~~TRINITY_DN85657_c0_g1_i1.p2  ORF type:complete len:123 (-),score=23.30 TRINITY_DN85657_c0_g1_i1:565-933(-)